MRVTFIIDGFNLYGSLVEVLKVYSINCKWLNVHSLFSAYLHLIDTTARLEEIYYFTAIQDYLKKDHPDKIRRHLNYIKCLESTGVKVTKGRFKRKDVNYTNKGCNVHIVKHEEKETDVAVAVKLLEILHLDLCDISIIVSGDTDLIPAVKTARNLFPAKTVFFLIPYCRYHSNELKKVAPETFKMIYTQYIAHQFPDPVTLADGTTISKPTVW